MDDPSDDPFIDETNSIDMKDITIVIDCDIPLETINDDNVKPNIIDNYCELPMIINPTNAQISKVKDLIEDEMLPPKYWEDYTEEDYTHKEFTVSLPKYTLGATGEKTEIQYLGYFDCELPKSTVSTDGDTIHFQLSDDLTERPKSFQKTPNPYLPISNCPITIDLSTMEDDVFNNIKDAKITIGFDSDSRDPIVLDSFKLSKADFNNKVYTTSRKINTDQLQIMDEKASICLTLSFNNTYKENNYIEPMGETHSFNITLQKPLKTSTLHLHWYGKKEDIDSPISLYNADTDEKTPMKFIDGTYELTIPENTYDYKFRLDSSLEETYALKIQDNPEYNDYEGLSSIKFKKDLHINLINIEGKNIDLEVRFGNYFPLETKTTTSHGYDIFELEPTIFNTSKFIKQHDLYNDLFEYSSSNVYLFKYKPIEITDGIQPIKNPEDLESYLTSDLTDTIQANEFFDYIKVQEDDYGYTAYLEGLSPTDIKVSIQEPNLDKNQNLEFELVQNDTPTGKKVILNASNNFTDTFKDMPLYEKGGQKITYKVKPLNNEHTFEKINDSINYYKGVSLYPFRLNYSENYGHNYIAQQLLFAYDKDQHQLEISLDPSTDHRKLVTTTNDLYANWSINRMDGGEGLFNSTMTPSCVLTDLPDLPFYDFNTEAINDEDSDERTLKLPCEYYADRPLLQTRTISPRLDDGFIDPVFNKICAVEMPSFTFKVTKKDPIVPINVQIEVPVQLENANISDYVGKFTFNDETNRKQNTEGNGTYALFDSFTLSEAKDYTYIINQEDTKLSNIEYDLNPKEVKFTVVKNNDGSLSIDGVKEENGLYTVTCDPFVNKYVDNSNPVIPVTPKPEETSDPTETPNILPPIETPTTPTIKPIDQTPDPIETITPNNNEKEPVVNTSDAFHKNFWITLCCLSLIGIVVAIKHLYDSKS